MNNLPEFIFPIAIETPFAVGTVYSYLIKDDKIVLIDCGHKSTSSFAQVKEAFKNHGLKLANLDEIWLTHGHPDHYGQAARLSACSGAVMKGHPKERDNFAANRDQSLFRTFFSNQNIPSGIIDEMLHQLDWLQQFQTPIEPEWITKDTQLSSGQLTFCVQHTPGHAPGHVVFYNDEGMLFGGDVLLEHISTNALINFDPDSGRRNKSLLQYRHSLQWIKKRNGRVLPGHGKQIHDITSIANHHLKEHEQRYQKIKALLEHPQSLMDLSTRIFADALASDKAYFLVFSGIMGYLDWGMERGEIFKEEDKFHASTSKMHHPT